MELTMTTAINTATTGERELNETELKHVSGGNEFQIRPNGCASNEILPDIQIEFRHKA
jgi:bacteriocin-like protein